MCRSILTVQATNQGGNPEGSRSPYAVHCGQYFDRELAFEACWSDCPSPRGCVSVADLEVGG